MPNARRPYPSDLSDAEWALLAPLLPPSAPCGRPKKRPERLIADAIFYVLRSGCAWRMLPREFPPWPTVYARFRHWRVSGTLHRAHDALRACVRVAEGRALQASAAVIDSQSAKSTGVGGPARGYDGAKRLKGRKRHLLVDTTGLVLLACVHAADLHDRDGARLLVETARPGELARLQLVWADQGYTGAFAHWLRDMHGCQLHVVRHPERQLWRYGLHYGLEEKPKHTFRVLPRRWVVERTFAWLGHSRRLSKDYERFPATSEAMIYGAMSRLMLRRLTGTAA
ncbi:MAG: IS5 family transposase [Chloroflexota bacterium]|nr:IS5 family transposase [Chloroflexota bacterium]